MLVIKRILKRKLLILAMLAMIFSANAQSSAYISDHKTMASLLSEKYGIPAAVILAVAYVESAGGNGAAARVLNNHFGIEGANSIVNSRGHKSRYKEYSNEIASYIDFCNLLTRKKFYSRLKNNDDPGVWVKALSHAGYSEQPQAWQQKILKTIKSNRL
jgi:Bax protein